MMEVAALLNRLLGKDSEGRRRKLRLRTYNVVCLNEESGLLQWVANTVGLRGEIAKCFAALRLSNPMAVLKELRAEIEALQADAGTGAAGGAAGEDARVARYRRAVLPRFPPVLHRWFLLSFADPTAWFEARVAFSRSAAAWSMVGHVVGLGDRHGENILLDRAAGECVHVDFDCECAAACGCRQGACAGRPALAFRFHVTEPEPKPSPVGVARRCRPSVSPVGCRGASSIQ